MTATTRLVWLAAVVLVVLCAVPGTGRADDGDCRDAVIGAGTVKSSTSGGTAIFAMAGGYLTPTSPLGGFFNATDSKGGFKIKSLTVDVYEGFHCGGVDPSGGPCYDRLFGGQAKVTLNGVTTTRPYLIETIITPNSAAPDYIQWNPNGCPDACWISLQLVTRGLMYIWNPDTTTPGCF